MTSIKLATTTAVALTAFSCCLVLDSCSRERGWKEVNPPSWGFLAETTDSRFYVSTEMLTTLPQGRVASVLKVKDKKKPPSQGSLHFVYVFGCSDDDFFLSRASRSVPLVTADTDSTDKVTRPLLATGDPLLHPFKEIKPGTILALHRQAACWLADNLQPSAIPPQYFPTDLTGSPFSDEYLLQPWLKGVFPREMK
jgi:hypothetical protein